MDDIVPMARHSFENIIRFLNGDAITPDDLIVSPTRPGARGERTGPGQKDSNS